MSYAVCRMQKVKSAGLKGMQFHNQRGVLPTKRGYYTLRNQLLNFAC